MTNDTDNTYTDRNGQVWVNKVEACHMLGDMGRIKFEKIIKNTDVPRYRRVGYHTIWFKIEDIERLLEAEEEFYLLQSPKGQERDKIPA